MQNIAVRAREESTPQPTPRWWRGERQTQTFRISILRLYASLAALHVALFFLIMLAEGTLTPLHFAHQLLLALSLDFAFSLVLSLFITVRAGEWGLQGHNFWGAPCRMRWDEIEAATPSYLLGLPWLKVKARDRVLVMWMPLFLADRRALYEQIARYAPECPVLPQNRA